MAQDTAISPLKGAPASGSKLEVYQRRIDFAVTGLASGAHFELFTMDTGDIVVGGCVIVAGGTTGGNEDFTIGIGGTGTTLLTATPVDTDAVVPLTATKGVSVSSDTVDLAMTVDAADIGTVDVTLVVLKAGDFAG
jgi:hypothetical protein